MLRVHTSGLEPPLPSRIRPDLTIAFDQPLLDALRFDARHRTPTVDDFRRQLLRARATLAAGQEQVRILVADDDADFRELARATLESGFPGAQIETVADGAQALASIDRERAALAVIDLDMPNMNGIEVTMALRANHDLPIIVCTAAGGAPDWRLLQSLGAVCFLVKPIDPYALIALARKALDARGRKS
jgi:serine/threonine-protein kinase